MKVLVTGASGFIGKNLCLWLKQTGYEVLKIDIDNSGSLEEYALQADFIIHLAGTNRPFNPEDFIDGNVNSIVKLVDVLKKNGKKTPILLSSSTQAENDNDYGKSKKQAEDFLFKYQEEYNSPVYVFRFANVFGKWCRPNYNSVVATFCYNQTHGIENKVNNPSCLVRFIYIDDICKTVINILKEEKWLGSKEILSINPFYDVTIGQVDLLTKSYNESRKNLMSPLQRDDFEKKLYATWLSYLEDNEFSYDLKMNVDNRGSFTEFFKTPKDGQFSINVGKPNIIKGNHYHHTKNEKFLVVKGTCSIKFRKIGTEKVFEYVVSDDKLQIIDIPSGYTHSITNIGKEDSVTLMWASELFDQNNPDTYYEEVIINDNKTEN